MSLKYNPILTGFKRREKMRRSKPVKRKDTNIEFILDTQDVGKKFYTYDTGGKNLNELIKLYGKDYILEAVDFGIAAKIRSIVRAVKRHFLSKNLKSPFDSSELLKLLSNIKLGDNNNITFTRNKIIPDIIKNKSTIIPKNKKELEFQLMSTKEASKMLGISQNLLRHWCKSGVGPTYYRIGNLFKYKKQELIEYIEKRKKNADKY